MRAARGLRVAGAQERGPAGGRAVKTGVPRLMNTAHPPGEMSGVRPSLPGQTPWALANVGGSRRRLS